MRVAALALGAWGAAACSSVPPSAPGSPAAAPRTWVFVCVDDASFVVRADARGTWLFRGGSGVRLSGIAAAEPLRLAGDGVALVIDGELGTLSVPGRPPAVCKNDRRRAVWEQAKLEGVDFRAVGNEPPWVLELRQGARIVLITDYGARRIERPLPTPVSDASLKTTRWDAGDLQIDVTATACHDSMSGEAFESRVAVHWAGRTLRGCGRALH